MWTLRCRDSKVAVSMAAKLPSLSDAVLNKSAMTSDVGREPVAVRMPARPPMLTRCHAAIAPRPPAARPATRRSGRARIVARTSGVLSRHLGLGGAYLAVAMQQEAGEDTAAQHGCEHPHGGG